MVFWPKDAKYRARVHIPTRTAYNTSVHMPGCPTTTYTHPLSSFPICRKGQSWTYLSLALTRHPSTMLVYSVGPLPAQQQMVETPPHHHKAKPRRPSVPVNSACNHCRRLHARCEDQRPCKRCVASGRENDCFDPEHKKRGRPRIYDVNIHRTTLDIAPRGFESQSAFSLQRLALRSDKPTAVPMPVRRDSSWSFTGGRASGRDLPGPQSTRRDSSSSEASWSDKTGGRSLMLPGAGTPPDTPIFIDWRNPFAGNGSECMAGGSGKDWRMDCGKHETRGVPHPGAKKGRCLSIDELLS
ncbi:hypothetical protein B0J12DRAFT_272530 [Macrophomina phaseolina]|uniref:Zn(2)-C6 fungal-type domain-containing protein n=1 Tax=Macrophomina phaseolina TaxID=35725 RepID=A0ABQ8FXU1_9PEZI|nr:hypothetical protein B0J12DRAFT_272530 [Macrophomina phaseolina]